MEKESNLSNEEKECVHHNRLVIDLLSKNVSMVIWSFILTNKRISRDAHHNWHVLEGMYTNQSDDEESDDEDEDESLEECNSSANCTSPLVIPFKRQENICSTTTVQENSVVPGFKTGGTGFGREENEEASSSEKSSPHSHSKVSTSSCSSSLSTYISSSDIMKGIKKGGGLKEKFDFELDKMTKKDKKNVLELIKRVRKQGDEISRQQAFQDSFKKELDKLKESNASLTSKCEELKGGYACATNSLSCAVNLK